MRKVGKFFWRFMVIFSFIINVVLIVTLLVVMLVIFDIKHNIAQPLIEGLHSSFVGLNDATIDWTIPVRTTIPLDTSIPLNTTIPLNTSIPLDTDTTVTLTQDVTLTIYGAININGTYPPVNVTLPKDLELPVHLNLDVPVNIDVPVNLDVPVDLDVPVSLDVRAVIPLSQTQLHDPVENLKLLFEPIVRILGNLPDNFSQVGPFASQVLSGSPPNLLAETPYSEKPWPGFSTTAGLNYDLANVPFPAQNVPALTGIVPKGGIPALDQGIRPEVYGPGTDPNAVNAQAAQGATTQNIPPQYYDGTYADHIYGPINQAKGVPPPADQGTSQQPPTDQGTNPQVPTDQGTTGGNEVVPTADTGEIVQPPVETPTGPSGDLGIISPPSSP